jgi:hypothetical protein
MPIPQKALDLENRRIGIDGEPTLAAAYEILKEQWRNGDRDRELGLHLMFLAWYGTSEPEYITGFSNSWEERRREMLPLFGEVHACFEPEIYKDVEMLYVVGLIAHMDWFMLDDDIEVAKMWEERSKIYHKQYRALSPSGIDPSVFINRGAYGDCFAGQAQVEGGY